MNLATPFLICHQNEDFRSLVREMLTKHGFFHVLEASSPLELEELINREKKSHFVLIQGNLIDESLTSLLQGKEAFIIVSDPHDEFSLTLATRFDIKCFISFPFSSQNLLDKIQQISQ